MYLCFGFIIFMGGNQSQQIKERVIAKRDQVLEQELKQLESLTKELNLTNEKIKEICSLNAHEAVEKLNSGSLTSKELVVSFAIRAADIGKRLCLFTQTAFGEALKMAEECDKNRKGKKNWTLTDGEYNSEKHLPPLYGIPLSVKDTYDMKGYTSSLGLFNRAEKEFEDSPIIVAMKKAGVIPFIRSNLPQFGMTFESMNDLWGRSLNPWNQERAVGGSSGGQGALIGSRCSLLGLGSDIGGSIRIPSQFCGVFGLKVTAKRFSANYHTKFSNAFSGSATIIPLCLGPLARSAQDLALWMKVATEPSFYERMDPYVANIRFDDKVYSEYASGRKKLKVGVVRKFQDLEPTKASSRAINQIEELLRKEGHEVVDISIPNEKQAIRSFFMENLGTGGQTYRDILKGEAPAKQYKSLMDTCQMWSTTRYVASVASSKLMPRLNYYIIDKGRPLTTFQYQQHIGQILDYRKEWANYWQDQKLDFAICIGFGSQAPPHGKSELTSLAASYTFIWNVLEMSVGAMPVTVVREDEQEYQTQFMDLCGKDLVQNAKNSVGMPAGIQVIGLPFEDEKVLGLMSYLEKKVNFYEKHPLPNP